jgi:hypothetical protein
MTSKIRDCIPYVIDFQFSFSTGAAFLAVAHIAWLIVLFKYYGLNVAVSGESSE